MIMSRKEICKQCQKDKWIQNSRGICPICVYINNHGGKTQQEVYLERQAVKNKTKGGKKVTGEKDLFLEIWRERKHYCTNKKCNKWLGNEPKASYFSHRRAKSIAPELRLKKRNIDLLCTDCHYIWDFGDKSKIIIE